MLARQPKGAGKNARRLEPTGESIHTRRMPPAALRIVPCAGNTTGGTGLLGRAVRKVSETPTTPRSRCARARSRNGRLERATGVYRQTCISLCLSYIFINFLP